MSIQEKNLDTSRGEKDTREGLFQSLIENSLDAIVLYNANGTITYASPPSEQVSGYKPEELVGVNGFSLIHPDDVERVKQNIISLNNTAGATATFEYRMKCKDGSWRWMEGTGRNLHDDPRVGELVGYFRNITEHKAAEQERNELLRQLQETHALLDTLFNQAPIGIGVWDREFRFVRVNETLAEMDNLPIEAHIGKTVQELLPEVYKRVKDAFQTVVETGAPIVELEIKGMQSANMGEDRYWSVSYYPIQLQDEVVGVGGLCEEITEEKRAEQAIRKSQERFELAQQAAHIGTFEWEIQEDRIHWTPELEALYGLPPGGFEGKYANWAQRVHPEDLQRAEESLWNAVRGGPPYNVEFRVIWPDGTLHWVHARGNVFFNAQHEAARVVGVNIDISEEKQAREALEQSEERFRFLADTMPQQVWTATPDGLLDYVNRRVIDYCGKSFDEIIGQGWQQILHPDDAANCLDTWQHALQTGQPYEIEFRLRASSGTYKWHLGRALPFISHGKIVTWFGTNTDIDDYKQLEQRKDDFISMATHELRSPLTTIKGNLQLARRQLKRLNDPSRMEETMGRIDEMLERAERQVSIENRLINDLLDVSRIRENKLELHPKTCNLVDVVRKVIKDQQMSARTRTIRIVLPEKDMVLVTADADRVEQVLTNYLTNAIKYSPAGKPIEVRLEPQETTVRVAVHDEGPGLSPEEQQQIWERFYQVPGRVVQSGSLGLGLGLYICQTIIQQHNGQVGVESTPGVGSTFWFTLPMIAA